MDDEELEEDSSALRCGRLTPELVERVLEIERRSFASPWSAADFRQVLGDSTALCVGMILQKTLIGYAIGYLDGADFHLANLAVDPRYRRRGWGGRLLCTALAEAWMKRCRNCGLEVRATNTAAVEFYRKHGFQQVAVRLGYYRKPRENALIMRRTIENFRKFTYLNGHSDAPIRMAR